jgi:hypothetical protein
MTPEDRQRIADAIRFYIDRVAWASNDPERAEYERIMRDIENAERAEIYNRKHAS